MPAALHALLERLIDYAGLFPPAALTLDRALSRYLEHRVDAESWMLGRFICPIARLAELRDLLPDGAAPLRLSVLPRGGDSLERFEQSVQEDCAALAEFSRGHADIARIESIEIKAPAALLADPTASFDSVVAVAARFTELDPRLDVFVEGASEPEVSRRLFRALHGVARVHGKLRTGGVTAEAFPAPRTLAEMVSQAAEAQVAWKATAGLHHPFRREDAAIGATMFGFVPLFLGAAMLREGIIDTDELASLLADGSVEIEWSENGASWRDHRISTEAILRARAWARSFGSCSFDEPRDDLRALGWL